MPLKAAAHSALCLVLILFCASGRAEDTFESYSAELDAWSAGVSGSVISSSPEGVVIDLGSDDGLKDGMSLYGFRAGEELFNPVNGRSLGRRTVSLGKIAIKKVEPKRSLATVEKTEIFKAGDKVALEAPLPLSFDFQGLSDNEKVQARYFILRNKRFVESPSSDYEVACVKPETSSSAVCSFKFRGSYGLVSADIPLTEIAVTLPKDDGSVRGRARNFPMVHFDKKFVTAAIGNGTGGSGPLTVAASDGKRLYLYAYFDNGTFAQLRQVERKFDRVVNVEFVDINGNGTDELLVSNLEDGKNPSSAVYEYNGGQFAPVASDIKYLFRTFYSSGLKTAVCQEFEEGEFKGNVAPYIFKDGTYSAGVPYNNALGARLYGFARIDSGPGDEIFGFGADGKLFVSDGVKKETYSGYFGDVPHKIKYVQEIIVGTVKDNDGKPVNEIDTKVWGIPVYQRILELSPGKLFLIGNIPVERKAVGEETYKSSVAGVYGLLGGKVRTFWSVDNNPAAVEADAVGDNKTARVLVLRNVELGFFGSAGSAMGVLKAEIK